MYRNYGGWRSITDPGFHPSFGLGLGGFGHGLDGFGYSFEGFDLSFLIELGDHDD